MPKKTEYVTDDELTKAVSGLLSNEEVPLADLRDNGVIILCCFKIRMDDDGETEPPKGSPVKLKKLSDLERLFVTDNAHYILTMDYHFWKNSNQQQQLATLFDLLMDIKPEASEAGLKLSKRDSDVPFRHAATVQLFGSWNEAVLLVRESFKNVGGRLKDFMDDIAASSAQPPETAAPEEGEPEPAAKPKTKPGVKK